MVGDTLLKSRPLCLNEVQNEKGKRGWQLDVWTKLLFICEVTLLNESTNVDKG